MKANIRIKNCPFCGGNINVTHGIIGAPFWFFICRKCGATVSFNCDECNRTPSRAAEYFNRRTADGTSS